MNRRIFGTIISRRQTTVPAGISEALGLSAGDKLRYESSDDGSVTLRQVPPLSR